MTTKHVEGTEEIESTLNLEYGFNVLEAFSTEETEALANLVSVRMKPIEIELLEKQYPDASMAELFIIYKMREAARNEIVAAEWRKNGGDWKNQATSLARQLVQNEVMTEKDSILLQDAQRRAAELGSGIPREYHEAVIKHVVVKLDHGSKDARVVMLAKIFANS
jgi:hypothetical protein